MIVCIMFFGCIMLLILWGIIHDLRDIIERLEELKQDD